MAEASSLANQGVLRGLSSKFDGKTPIRVHFLDNSSKVFLADTDSTTVKDLVVMCMNKYEILDVETNYLYFSIFESRNGATIDGALAMEAKLVEVLKAWEEAGIDKTAKFLFMIRLYIPCLWGIQHKDVVARRLGVAKSDLSFEDYILKSETIDRNCLSLQFMQAVYHIITHRYPTSAEEALTLGAIHFISKFGEYKPSSHKVGFLGNRIVEFIPTRLLKSGTEGSIQDWEAKLMENVKNMSSPGSEVFTRNGSSLSPERVYMEKIYRMPFFGTTMFRCTQKSSRALPDLCFIGVYEMGLRIFEKSKKLLREFFIEDIYRWGFKPRLMFYFEISPDEKLGSSLEFETTEGKVISDLLTDYALAYLKEREAEDARTEKGVDGKSALDAAGGAIDSVMVLERIGSGDDHNNGSSVSGRGSGPPAPPARPPPSTAPPGAGGTATRLENGSRGGRKSVMISSSSSPSGSSFPWGADAGLMDVPSPPAPHAPKFFDASAVGGADGKEFKAAQKMQAVYRGYALRNEWAREDAAILIQSVYRGYKARVNLSKMIEEMIAQGQL